MKMARYYRNATLYPALLAVFFTIIVSSILNRDYKSEWLTAGSVIAMSVGIAMVYSLLLSLLCLTIFLVAFETVKRSRLLTAISWFFLPLSGMLIVLCYAINTQDGEGDGEEFVYLCGLNFPFLAGLLFTWLHYRKSLDCLPSKKRRRIVP